jgi:hypothetical protein
VEEGINSISFNPDALLNGIENIRNAEEAGKPALSVSGTGKNSGLHHV